MKKIFIDGGSGTVGLKLAERLQGYPDIKMLRLPAEISTEAAYRREMLNQADVAFLCLPDEAARESVALCENENTVIIDASTAHRTAPGWAYGFPELGSEYYERIAASRRIAVPGCHASGFIALVQPLVRAGVISSRQRLSCFSLTGYSGGGKNMIKEYEAPERSPLLAAPRLYALPQQHKHLPEMRQICALEEPPVFLPVVGDFPRGMQVNVPLSSADTRGGIEAIRKVYRELYTGQTVRYVESLDEGGFVSACAMAEKDSMLISVSGNEQRMVLTALFDNLGKGASGTALECLNITLGNPLELGLSL